MQRPCHLVRKLTKLLWVSSVCFQAPVVASQSRTALGSVALEAVLEIEQRVRLRATKALHPRRRPLFTREGEHCVSCISAIVVDLSVRFLGGFASEIAADPLPKSLKFLVTERSNLAYAAAVAAAYSCHRLFLWESA